MNTHIFKQGLLPCLFFLSILFISHTGLASPIYIGNSLDLIHNGSNTQNDKDDNVNWLVNNYSGLETLPTDLILYGEWGNKWSGTGTPFTGDFQGNEGNWFAPDTWEGPLYYSIKAGGKGKSDGGFELWYANGETAADWNTLGLKNHDLSHISFWSATGSPQNPNPVPEASTMVLLGAGLMGIVGMRKKIFPC